MSAEPNPDESGMDLITELRFALAEAETESPAADFRSRLLDGAALRRRPGFNRDPEPAISGAEAFERMAASVLALLDELAEDEWSRPATRGLDVAELAGHMLGVDRAFRALLIGESDAAAGADHIASTQADALAQNGRAAADTLADLRASLDLTRRALAADTEPDRFFRFHGIPLSLDGILAARTFEFWAHSEDIRRATGRAPADPEPATLERMTRLATQMLPLGIALAGRQAADAAARLVLTGPGGGTWDVPLGGEDITRARPGSVTTARVVVGAAAFCRVAANRATLAGSRAVMSGDPDLAERLFAGAAALALD